MSDITTCQICARPIKSSTGFIAHHGYRRPSIGWQTGSCSGTGYVPYEVGCDQLRKEIDRMIAFIAKEEQDLQDFLNNPPQTIKGIERRRGRDELVTYEKPEGFTLQSYYRMSQTYENEYHSRKSDYTQRIKMMKGDLIFMQERLAAWKGSKEA